MCLICVEFNKLTVTEAKRNMCEMRSNIIRDYGQEHIEELEAKIHEKAVEELNDMLENFDPFVEPPTVLDEGSPFFDEPLDLKLDDDDEEDVDPQDFMSMYYPFI